MYFKINVLCVLLRFLKTLKNRFGQCIFKDHTLSKIPKNSRMINFIKNGLWGRKYSAPTIMDLSISIFVFPAFFEESADFIFFIVISRFIVHSAFNFLWQKLLFNKIIFILMCIQIVFTII